MSKIFKPMLEVIHDGEPNFLFLNLRNFFHKNIDNFTNEDKNEVINNLLLGDVGIFHKLTDRQREVLAESIAQSSFQFTADQKNAIGRKGWSDVLKIIKAYENSPMKPKELAEAENAPPAYEPNPAYESNKNEPLAPPSYDQTMKEDQDEEDKRKNKPRSK